MPFEFKVTRRVEFSETDMAGIVHYSNFFKYMESAEHAFFRSLGFSIVTENLETPLGWPRVHAQCDFSQPLRFEEEFEVHLLVQEKKSRTLTYLFRFTRLKPSPVPVARGVITVVCVTRDAAGKMTAAPIPAEIAGQIEVAPAELLGK